MRIATKILLIFALVSCLSYSSKAGTPPPVPSQEEPEVLNQGPMHEAFAQPVDMDPQPSVVAPNEPPSDIIENPSIERPESADYVWIPGYWGWDPEHQQYIWISGCWRIPPANMSWVPGYWNKVDNGWQWVAGFWIPTTRAAQIQYLPKPPELTNTEPPATTTVVNQIWVPPCYYWRDNQYILRDGYWLVPQSNWVWIPSHYSWTPYGYVFVSGYWDYVLTTRGVLYAPVYFPRRFYRMPGYSYSLSVIVDLGNLQFSLFSDPLYCHYFFGDYYNDAYLGFGIYPWFEFQTRHTWYDPLYEYDRWHYSRTIPHWGEHIRQEYDLRRNNVSLRPPRTYRELQTRLSGTPQRERNDFRMVEPFQQQINNQRSTLQLSRMSTREQQSIRDHSNEVNNFRQERSRIENHQVVPQRIQPSIQPGIPEQRAPQGIQRVPVPGGTSGRLGTERQGFENRRTPERMNFPRSPITGRNTGGVGELFRSNSSPSRSESEGRFDSGGEGRVRR